MPGIFTISLDLELYWGTRDKLSLAQYQDNILGTRQAVPALLRLFGDYQVGATWAVVGFLMCRNKDQLLECLPPLKPQYQNPRLSPYPEIDAIGFDEHDDPLHFGASLVDQIVEAPRQELATHTLSHYYCLEPGQNPAEFDADLRVALQLAHDRYGREIKSIVFPRNQVELSYLQVCEAQGLQAYRGNEPVWFYQAHNEAETTWAMRLMRASDTFINLAGDHIYLIEANAGLINVPSSRFLRPYSRRLELLEGLRLRRIFRSMEAAVRRNQVFHLWWHPENFGINLEQNLRFLKQILEHYARLRDSYGMQSLTMLEVAHRTRLKSLKSTHAPLASAQGSEF